MKVVFYCGGHEEVVTLPEGETEDDIQTEYDIWLSNRSDLGWSVLEGKTAEESV